MKDKQILPLCFSKFRKYSLDQPILSSSRELSILCNSPNYHCARSAKGVSLSSEILVLSS